MYGAESKIISASTLLGKLVATAFVPSSFCISVSKAKVNFVINLKRWFTQLRWHKKFRGTRYT